MPDHLGGDMRRVKDDDKEDKIQTLDEGDIALLKTYVSWTTASVAWVSIWESVE
jgi:hypothetical protein